MKANNTIEITKTLYQAQQTFLYRKIQIPIVLTNWNSDRRSIPQNVRHKGNTPEEPLVRGWKCKSREKLIHNHNLIRKINAPGRETRIFVLESEPHLRSGPIILLPKSYVPNGVPKTEITSLKEARHFYPPSRWKGVASRRKGWKRVGWYCERIFQVIRVSGEIAPASAPGLLTRRVWWETPQQARRARSSRIWLRRY